MTRAHIVATGAYLPGPPISNEAVAELVGPLPDDVMEQIGVDKRHWIVDPSTGEHCISNSGMAAEAVRRALAAAGMEPGELELLVISTSSPDYHLPPMVTFVQDALGLSRLSVLELRSGCAGAVQALDVARLRIEHGDVTNAVVVGSEASSPLLVPLFRSGDPGALRVRDRLTAFEFADGAGAIVLKAGDDRGGVTACASECIGGGKKPGLQVIGGGTHAPFHRQFESSRPVELKLDSTGSIRSTPDLVVAGLRATLASSHLTAADIGAVLIPEGDAAYLTDGMKEVEGNDEWMAVAPRVIGNLAAVGATGSAAVPLLVDQAARSGALVPGQNVMLLALETSKWIYAGANMIWTMSS